MSLLRVDQVTKRFASNREEGGTEALSDLSFAIEAGEFVSLLGPSGCGKSTALRLVAGLLAPDSGSVVWNGASTRKSAERHEVRSGFPPGRATIQKSARPELGFVFQDATLMPWADTRANARLPLDLKENAAQRESDARAACVTGAEFCPGLYSESLSPRIVRRHEDAGFHRPRPGGRAARPAAG